VSTRQVSGGASVMPALTFAAIGCRRKIHIMRRHLSASKSLTRAEESCTVSPMRAGRRLHTISGKSGINQSNGVYIVALPRQRWTICKRVMLMRMMRRDGCWLDLV